MIKEIIQKLVIEATSLNVIDFQVEKTKSDFGDYAVNVAFVLAKKENRNPNDIAKELAIKLDEIKPNEIERIEAVGGYVNFFLGRQYLQESIAKISSDEKFGFNSILNGKTVMVEYTDPNPFKLFHIGHLMSNSIGEAIARLHEASGAKVIRANYQGDVGLHVAMTVWAMKNILKELPTESEPILNKVDYLGKCYVAGSKAYRDEIENNQEKKEIEAINDKLYSRDESEINTLYDLGRKWSLEYFEEIYKKLGTKFDQYFFESEAGKDGLKIVTDYKKIFEESDDAVIFRGENYGLHTRVFVNKNGLPTYEAKELGLNKKKFEMFPLDLSIVVTGNEINDYFRVLLKVMELIIPEVAKKTRHIGHGMLRLPTGKMSSRTGDVITAESLIDEVKERLRKVEVHSGETSAEEKEANLEPIAIGAIKYSILKQSPGRDVIFDFDKSLSIEGDSGPYLQYTFARLNSILTKAGASENNTPDYEKLAEKSELDIIRHLIDFPEIVEKAGQSIAPQHLAVYLFQLANLANTFYEKIRILTDEDKPRLYARLSLIKIVAKTLDRGLEILGIKTLEKI
jgi:arginyl-tRNA synthetase